MGRMNTHKMPAMPRPTALIPGLLLASLLATGLTGCGQKGPLFIPATPAAAQRATLPQIIVPALPRDGAGKSEESGARPATANGSSTAPGAAR